MSLAENQSIESDQIIEYLENHPEFFNKNPTVLCKLVIPHQVNRNVSSLMEYQSIFLKDQNRNIYKERENLVKKLEYERKLANAAHKLILELQASSSPDQLYEISFKWLKNYYSANRLVLIIIGNPDSSFNNSDLRGLEKNSKLEFMFTEIFYRNKPLCNSLQEEHLGALFGEEIDRIKSTVLLPFSSHARRVLLVLGSYKTDRYIAGFKLDLLFLISRIISMKLDLLLAENTCQKKPAA